ncbi:MAG: response regulator [Alphaproteobacteria bacterium]|nr:response regulator [Alphaproteobacteria bacterium]
MMLPRSLRVILVEDEALIAMIIEEMISDLGCTAIGPAATLDEALSLVASTTDADCALLDINLRGASSWPIADALRAKGVPFAFVSGYGPAGLEPKYKGETVLAKPIDTMQLETWLTEVASRGV